MQDPIRESAPADASPFNRDKWRQENPQTRWGLSSRFRSFFYLTSSIVDNGYPPLLICEKGRLVFEN